MARRLHCTATMDTHIVRWATAIVLLAGSALCACSSASTGAAAAPLPPPGSPADNPAPGAVADASASGADSPDAALIAPPPSEAGAASDSGGAGAESGGDGGAHASSARVVAYLPNYSGSYADWATKIDFSKMTHLNLAFASGTSQNGWDMGAPDDQVAALVSAAHAAGVKVLASLGGGGGDQSVIAQFKDSSNIAPFVANLDTFASSHAFDGVDIDIEDPNNLGANYSLFVSAVVAKLRPEGKLVTAAVAQYLQDSMADDTLHQFDFLNVMIYSSYADSVSAMTYYTGTKSVPAAALSLGAGFFGTDGSGNEYAYSAILAADPNAWSSDQAKVNGNTVNYTGMASMKKLADYSKAYGGIMFWELSEDTTDAHSLYKVIQGAM